MFLFIFGVIGTRNMLGWLGGNKKHYIFLAGLQVTPKDEKNITQSVLAQKSPPWKMSQVVNHP